MKVVILCGGFGTRLREETEAKPKPMVEIGDKPILWHIMKTYAHYGFNEFILCLGYKQDTIKEYFCNYEMLTNDFTIDLADNQLKFHTQHKENWKVTLVDTGLNAMTGARIKRIEKYIDGKDFMVTYGDGVIDMDINKLIKFHNAHGKIGTVTGVTPQSRYGELCIEDDQVVSFEEKPENKTGSISGGYFVFKKEIFKYVQDDDKCVFEKDALQKLARDKELNVYAHNGFWQCMDTYRDYKYLQNLLESGQAKWKKW